MKIQYILNALDNVVFGKLSYRFLVTMVSVIFAAIIEVVMLCLGLKRQYLEISAFLLPIPALIIVCIAFEFLKGKMVVEKPVFSKKTVFFNNLPKEGGEKQCDE